MMQKLMPNATLVSAQVERAVPISDVSISIEQFLRDVAPPARAILRALVSAQREHKVFIPGQPLVVAVSGGADSICLLHALHQLAPFWQLSLHVAHVDHALRPDSVADAAFVADFARHLGLPLYITRLTPDVLNDDPRGLEAAARAARYAFLRQVARQVGTPATGDATDEITHEAIHEVTVVTAHHQDDQAETLLLHLIQGSGLTGLAGMAWVGQLPDSEQPPIRLVRPLLGVDRATIQSYLQAYELRWREDATNRDSTYLRNHLRHHILPALAEINPNIHATLARTADLLAAEAEHANYRDRAALAAVTVTHTPSVRLVLDYVRLGGYDLATRRGVLRQALISLGIDLRTVGSEGIDALLGQIVPPATSGPHPLAENWVWTLLRNDNRGDDDRRDNDRRDNDEAYQLALHRSDALPVPVVHPHLGQTVAEAILLPSTGTVTHAEWQLHSTLFTPAELPPDWRDRAQRWRVHCDAERSSELYLTTPKPGMQIAPLGMGGQHRNLGDIFTDHKIPTYLRPGWPVVVREDGTVVWLCGLVLADCVRIHSATRQVRQLHWEPHSYEQANS